MSGRVQVPQGVTLGRKTGFVIDAASDINDHRNIIAPKRKVSEIEMVVGLPVMAAFEGADHALFGIFRRGGNAHRFPRGGIYPFV